MEVVEIGTPQFAKSVAGVVNDPLGGAVSPGIKSKPKQCERYVNSILPARGYRDNAVVETFGIIVNAAYSPLG